MKRAAKKTRASGFTTSQGYAQIAESMQLKPVKVRTVGTSDFGSAAAELKKNGKFNLGGVLNVQLKKKQAKAARRLVNPFTKEPCGFKTKSASKTSKVHPMTKFKEMDQSHFFVP